MLKNTNEPYKVPFGVFDKNKNFYFQNTYKCYLDQKYRLRDYGL